MFGLFRKKKDPIQEELEYLRNREEPTFETATAAQAAATGDFRMMVEDVFTITGRGTVVTGRVEVGIVRTGDIVRVNGTPYTVTGIEAFRKNMDSATAGDNVGLLLRNANRAAFKRGDIITH